MSTAGTSPMRALSPEQLRQYDADGFLVLRRLFGAAEMEHVIAEAEAVLARHELIDEKNLRCRWQPHVDSGEKLFETFDPVIDIAPACAAIAADRRILDTLEAIYGDEACLFKDKLIYKPPGAHGYGLHQDYIAWPDFPKSFVTVLVSLDAADADNGCTELFAGCHRDGCLSLEDGQYHELDADRFNAARCVRLSLAPGDVVVFGCFTLHRSAPNRSSRWRRQLYLSYNARGDGGELRARHYRRFHDWLARRYTAQGTTDMYFR